jgi:hypothetical protein
MIDARATLSKVPPWTALALSRRKSEANNCLAFCVEEWKLAAGFG